VPSNLEKALENWKQYNSGIESLTAFINEGESVMSRSNEEKQQHFSEIPQYQDKLQQVKGAGNFLMGVCREPVAEEIRETLALLDTEFKTVTESFEEFKKVEIIGRGRQEYSDGVNRISEWLKNAEELMMQPIPCVHSNLKDHLQDMTVSTTDRTVRIYGTGRQLL
jgi:chaperonin cofactor prefoldin